MASAKINESIIAIKILAEAAGLRATAFIAAAPTKPITVAGPAVLRNINRINTKFVIFYTKGKAD